MSYSGKHNIIQVFLIVTLFIDIISKHFFAEFQHNIGSEETFQSKRSMMRDAKTVGVQIKSFRSDTGIFKIAGFRTNLKDNDQIILFCAVGVHHQNGVAERYIRTMVEMAITLLLNTHTRWLYQIKLELWTYAFRHVVT